MDQLNIFEKHSDEELGGQAPLAERMRPRNLGEFIGQPHLLGPGKILDRIIRNRHFQSLILWGPPGSGKTTLAKIVSTHTESFLVSLSAVMAGAKEIRAAVQEAKEVLAKRKIRTWLFMDEIHRLNKAQQDTLLPHVENGTILLVGATTENPSFEIIRPLLSRTQVVVLEPLEEADMRQVIDRALSDAERGLGKYPALLTQEAVDYLLAASGGDARVILNALELAVLTTAPDSEGIRNVDLEGAKEAMLSKPVHYDKAGEEHFNLISALHKSVRGSDPDAALYWLARMLEAGEDPLYLARRIVRMACEDIGLADPSRSGAGHKCFSGLSLPRQSRRGTCPCSGYCVSLPCAQEQFAIHRFWGRFGSGQEQWRRPGASAPAQRAHRAFKETGIRQRIQIRSRLRGRVASRGLHARGAGWHAFL